jgi:hypothetical protein
MLENQIRNVMRHHEIPACWHRAFCRLFIDGAIDDPRFDSLTENDPEFKAACEMIQDVLSEPYADLFESDDADRACRKRALAIAGT